MVQPQYSEVLEEYVMGGLPEKYQRQRLGKQGEFLPYQAASWRVSLYSTERLLKTAHHHACCWVLAPGVGWHCEVYSMAWVTGSTAPVANSTSPK